MTTLETKISQEKLDRVIIIGPSCSGKTSLSQRLLANDFRNVITEFSNSTWQRIDVGPIEEGNTKYIVEIPNNDLQWSNSYLSKMASSNSLIILIKIDQLELLYQWEKRWEEIMEKPIREKILKIGFWLKAILRMRKRKKLYHDPEKFTRHIEQQMKIFSEIRDTQKMVYIAGEHSLVSFKKGS
jgi:adenylate kinase family enzyme